MFKKHAIFNVQTSRMLLLTTFKERHGLTQPPTIDHFIGQHQVVARFKVALEAAWNDGTRLPHMLMVGPPGVGKTLLAHLAGREMGVAVHDRLAQTIHMPGSLNGLLLQAADKEIVFIDEIHELAPEAQTLLYRALEEGEIFLHQPDGSAVKMPICDATIIGATTDEYRLLDPLRDRFALVLPFTYYDSDSLAKIVHQRAIRSGIELDADVPEQIALRSRGTPRLAIRLLDACYRYTRSINEKQITMENYEKTAELENIDSLGLGSDEQRYLELLAERSGERIRLFTIEATLGIHRRTIQAVIEPYLIRTGLVERHAQGRTITEKGLRHLGMISEDQMSIAWNKENVSSGE